MTKEGFKLSQTLRSRRNEQRRALLKNRMSKQGVHKPQSAIDKKRKSPVANVKVLDVAGTTSEDTTSDINGKTSGLKIRLNVPKAVTESRKESTPASVLEGSEHSLEHSENGQDKNSGHVPLSPKSPSSDPFLEGNSMCDDDMYYLDDFENENNIAPLTPLPEPVDLPKQNVSSTTINDTPNDHNNYSIPSPSFSLDEILECAELDTENIDANTTTNTNSTHETTTKRKPLFTFYNQRVNCVSGSFDPPTSTLIAALRVMARDGHPGTREAYYESALLAAVGLNQHSLVSGKARQTMAPDPTQRVKTF
ncbi:hypothetical protein DASB73_004200 [Starmerella bacillaris]|uniref:Uncharacterized protein n=1 Tax=Starmerella bacillaris TaxID=1247836 RepID=A0AAV5RES1_STABA|nr:hypothetical protein DASB73_004200 [Starmerella bacillaris]